MDQPGGPTYSAAPAGAAAYETPAQGPRLHYQSVGIRFAANLIDGLVLGLVLDTNDYSDFIGFCFGCARN